MLQRIAALLTGNIANIYQKYQLLISLVSIIAVPFIFVSFLTQIIDIVKSFLLDSPRVCLLVLAEY